MAPFWTLVKALAAEHLGKNIRQNMEKGHSSIEDARVTMQLYKKYFASDMDSDDYWIATDYETTNFAQIWFFYK